MPELPVLPDEGADAATFEKRQKLRALLLLLGYDLPTTMTDLSGVSDKLVALQKEAGDALKAFLTGPNGELGPIGPDYGTEAEYAAKLEHLLGLQDQLAEMGDLFSEYAMEYFGKLGDDKSKMTEAQAAKFLNRDDYMAWLTENGYSGERLKAEIAEFDMAKEAAAAEKSTMTASQAARYLTKDKYQEYLTKQGFTGDRLAAEMKDYEEANKELSEPTKAQAARYMNRGGYEEYLSSVLGYKGNRLAAEMADYDRIMADQKAQAQQSGGGSQSGGGGGGGGGSSPEPYDPVGIANAQNNALRAQMQNFRGNMQPAVANQPRVPTQEEFLSDFDNAFDKRINELLGGSGAAGPGGYTNEMDFARRVMKPMILSKYTAALGSQASPFRVAGAGASGGGGGTGGLPSTHGNAGSIDPSALSKYGISRGTVMLPSVMPGDFLAKELTMGEIMLAYEGSSRGAGAFRSAGTGTTVATRS